MKNLKQLLLVLALVITTISINKTKVDAFDYPNKLIVVSDGNISIDKVKKRRDEFKNIKVELINANNLNTIQINEEDIICVDINTLVNEDIKLFVLSQLEDGYILFFGDSSVNHLSEQLGIEMTVLNPVFDIETGKRISNELVQMSDNIFSILKYTENMTLKNGIESIDLGNCLNFEEYLVPCFEELVISNSATTYSTELEESYNQRVYFRDKDTGDLLDNYLVSIMKIYKVIAENDENYDYYIFGQLSYFKEYNNQSSTCGHYLNTKHTGASSNISYCTDAKPTNSSGTTSYSFSVGTSGADFNISYSGPKAKISLTRSGLTNSWTIQDATLLSNANFNSGDSFEFASEYKVAQGKIPTFEYTVYALDKGNGCVPSTTRECTIL